MVQLCPPLVPQIALAFGLMIFTVFGLGPTVRFLRSSVFKVCQQNTSIGFTAEDRDCDCCSILNFLFMLFGEAFWN